MERDNHKRSALSSQRLIIFGVGLIVLGVGGFFIWKASQQDSLLPKDLTSANVPYFYFDQVPAGYHIKETRTDDEFGVTAIGLAKAGRPEIILTEQKVSNSPGMEALAKNGEEVNDTPYPAVINSVEGRLVGIMSDSKSLVIFNAPTGTDKQDLKRLLQGLEPTN
jgi:hypothetical protein